MGEKTINWRDFIEHAEISDVGLRRTNNQDSYTVVMAGSERKWRDRGHLFIVADGMGAHAAGELASKMAVDAIPHTYHKMQQLPVPLALKKAIEEANESIHSRGQANAEFHGMGTTTSALVIVPQGAVVAHVGDSRVYRLRGNRLEQLSFDHSLVWELMAGGQMEAGEVPSYVPKNIITRSLGPHAEVDVDLEGPFPLVPGDRFLLCSDGLSGQVTDKEIGVILGCLSPREAAQVLVDLANLRGGPDNITVLSLRVTDDVPAHNGEPLSQTLAAESNNGAKAAVWGTLAASFLAAGVLTLIHPLVGLGTAVAGAVAAAILHNRMAPKSPIGDVPAGRLGRGPHTSCICTPDLETVTELSKVLEQLRAAGTEEDWVIDWSKFLGFEKRAREAQASSDLANAVREYCRGVSFMMQQLKSQHESEAPRAEADS